VSALDKRRERDAAKVAAVRVRSGAGSPAAERTKTGKPRKGSGGPRPDDLRLIEVERLFLQLKGTGAIVREIVSRFGVDERTVYNDLVRVRAEYAPTDEERRERRNQHRATLVRMMEQAELEGDPRLARDLAADLARLDGLNEPDRVEHSGTIQTGVLVVPTQPASAEQWAEQFGKAAQELEPPPPPDDDTGGG